jgi:hypothetical protein
MKNILRSVLVIVLLKISLFATTEYIVLIDYSKSIGKDDQKIYKKTLGSVLGKMKSGDRISLVDIGQNDLSNFEFFDQVSMKKGFTNKVKIYNRNSLKKLWKRFLNKPFETENATNIISAIRGSTQRFNRSQADTKVLIILSDMIDSSEESQIGQFAQGENCSQIKSVVSKINKPNLDTVNVYVAGAGGIGDKGYNCLKKFWQEFFIQSGVARDNLVYLRINPFE